MPDWNELFTAKENRWLTPFEDVAELVDAGAFDAQTRVLDLGSGAGRHLKYLSEHGIPVVGMDLAWNGLISAQELLHQEGYPTLLIQADMSEALPYTTDCFDSVISIHVIFHNPVVRLKSTLAEIKRVLKPGGLALITFNTVYNSRFGRGIELEPATWVPDTGIDRGIPHHFSSFTDLADLLSLFKVLKVRLDEHVEESHNSSHWVVLVQKQ